MKEDDPGWDDPFRDMSITTFVNGDTKSSKVVNLDLSKKEYLFNESFNL